MDHSVEGLLPDICRLKRVQLPLFHFGLVGTVAQIILTNLRVRRIPVFHWLIL